MTGLRSSPFTLFPERDIRDKGSEAIVQGIERTLLNATYSFELLKRDVERVANQSALNNEALGDVLTADDLATVATTGSYKDLTDKPALATVASSGLHSDLTLDDGTNPHGTTASDLGMPQSFTRLRLTSTESSFGTTRPVPMAAVIDTDSAWNASSNVWTAPYDGIVMTSIFFFVLGNATYSDPPNAYALWSEQVGAGFDGNRALVCWLNAPYYEYGVIDNWDVHGTLSGSLIHEVEAGDVFSLELAGDFPGEFRSVSYENGVSIAYMKKS